MLFWLLVLLRFSVAVCPDGIFNHHLTIFIHPFGIDAIYPPLGVRTV